MILRRLVPSGRASDPAGEPVAIDLDAPDARDRIVDLYRPPRPEWLRINLVATISGNAAGPDGTSDSITSAVDRVILRVIRSLADVVVVGAASVRAEGYFVPREAALAVVSASGDLSGHRVRNVGAHGPLLVLCPAASVERARATVGDPQVQIVAVPAAEGSLSAAAIVAALHTEGYTSIVAEGGPTLAAHLAAGGVVDELCLTTTPELGGVRLPMFGSSELSGIPLTLDQLLVDDAGALYARWRFPDMRA